MDKAKKTVLDFMSRDGEHNTVVDRDERKAVTDEHIRPHRHEEMTTAVDKEVHQDHHRTVVQPIKVSEKIPEKHTHNALPVEHKTFEHDNTGNTGALLDRDLAKYKDNSVIHDTTHSSSQVKAAGSEHVHHHLHEHIQPVIQKETVQPEVVHSTQRVHEMHHAATVDHGTTTLPAKTWEEFERDTGTLNGRGAITMTEFEGCAKDYIDKGAGSNKAEVHSMPKDARSGVNAPPKSALKQPAGEGNLDRHSSSDQTSSSDNYKMSSKAASKAYTGAAAAPRSSEAAPPAKTTSGTSATSSVSHASKASLKDRLNPFKDSNGDGKKGILS